MDHNADQAVEENGSPVFDSWMIDGDTVRFRHVVVEGDEDRSQWLGSLKQLHSFEDGKRRNRSTGSSASMQLSVGSRDWCLT